MLLLFLQIYAILTKYEKRIPMGRKKTPKQKYAQTPMGH